jgi:aconitate hydratase
MMRLQRGFIAMRGTVTGKLIASHMPDGSTPKPGDLITINIDQTLCQDATGTTVANYLTGIPGLKRLKPKLAVFYHDHNIVGFGDPRNANDGLYLQTVAAHYGAWFSKAGGGICHDVHIAHFSRPGETMVGSDSHTPTMGAVGMLAIGTGGMNVVVAMLTGKFQFICPRVVGVRLRGEFKPFVEAKDLILEMLRRRGTDSSVNAVIEYFGPGAEKMTVEQRATVVNMGAELGATTSVFASDENTRRYFEAQGRSGDWRELLPDADAEYDEMMEIDLDQLEPLVAVPHNPGNIKKISDVKGTPIHQVVVGSCTNARVSDLAAFARFLEKRPVKPGVQVVVTPASQQVMRMATEMGIISTLYAAGAQVTQPGCGACIGQHSAPADNTNSFRTINRNFIGRCGTHSAGVYLGSPSSAAAAAISGEIVDPRELATELGIEDRGIYIPSAYITDNNFLVPPRERPEEVKIVRPPTIGPAIGNEAYPSKLDGVVAIKVGDKVSTDTITPAGRFLADRSNIERYSQGTFHDLDPEFAERAVQIKDGGKHGVIIAGESYGEGSSREHAALCPMYLGIKMVIAKGFQRIHRENLINYGIIPAVFTNASDYDHLSQGDEIKCDDVIEQLGNDSGVLKLRTVSGEITVKHGLYAEQVAIIKAGTKLNYLAQQHA